MKSQPIGFFDSGVGLLSVLDETKKLLPNQNYAVFADQKHIPFGGKSQRQLAIYASNAINFLISNHDIQMAVIACNTASVTTLDHLRKKFQLPIVGVVPAIKPAAEITKNNKIAVLATTHTAKSKYLKDLIKKYASGKKVLRVACPQLAKAIEDQNELKIKKLLTLYLNNVKKFEADTVVLGCTHYSLIKDDIQKILGDEVKVLDSAKAVARRVAEILPQKGNIEKSQLFLYSTADPRQFSKVASRVLKCNIDAKKAD